MGKHTPLYNEHLKLQGKMVDFGGWDLPVQYRGLKEEHLACRKSAALFDVSHMGEIELYGKDASQFLNYLLINNLDGLVPGQAQYTAMCHETGGIVDDLVAYQFSKEHYLLVVNASNSEKDWNHIQSIFQSPSNLFKNVTLKNVSNDYAQLALQGPKSLGIAEQFFKISLKEIKFYHFKKVTSSPFGEIIFSRTGYTGEDGFEIYCNPNVASTLWQGLLEVGKPFGLEPAGLGARDTLRLEMKYALYGHELTDQTNPLEAGLGWITKLQKQNFVGKKAIELAKSLGVSKKLIGFELMGPGIARQNFEAFSGEHKIGTVTSGTLSPSLNKSIGIAYLDTAHAHTGCEFEVDIRGRRVGAQVVETPFYKRGKS